MKLRLTNPNETVPGGFRFTVEGGTTFNSHSLADLGARVRSYLRGNGKTIPADLDAQIEEVQCQSAPHSCYDADRGAQVSRPTIDFRPVVSFLNMAQAAAKKLSKGQTPFVDQEQSNGRAEVCARCPLNMSITGCSACNVASSLADAMSWMGAMSTEFDSQLQGCSACGCALKAKVHMRKELMMGQGDISAYHKDCWLRSEP